jgi:acetyl esterase/lipase
MRTCVGAAVKAGALSAVLAFWALGFPAQSAGAPDPADVLNLYPGPAPGSEGPQAPEINDGLRVRNVSTPTLTVFRPRPGLAGDVAIIIAPGGGFEHLSIANEGYDVARRLADHGVTAIVLKYRIGPSAPRKPVATPDPGPRDTFKSASPQMTSRPLSERIDEQLKSPVVRTATDDAANAVRYVRAHAGELQISPKRVGFIGFSAGAVLSMELALSRDPDTRPDFVASIYGAMDSHATVDAAAPPLFLAVAADDTLVGPDGSLPILQAWRAAGRDVELHVYQSGGHGFGMAVQHKTSDHWIDEYLWWLQARGLIAATPQSAAPQ